MLDAESLYSNIPNHEVTAVAKSALNSISQKLIVTKVIIRFLSLILILNSVVFNGIPYR